MSQLNSKLDAANNVIDLFELAEKAEETFSDECKVGFDRFFQQGAENGLPLVVMLRAVLSGLNQSARDQSPKFDNPFKNEIIDFLHDHYEIEISDERTKKFKDAFETM